MAKVIPFSALRYDVDKVKMNDVVAPPYDIISQQYQEELYQRSPYNIVRLEYGKEEVGDNEALNKYLRAGEHLNEFVDKGVLKADNCPAIYVYEQIFTLPNGENKKLRGIMCLVELEEFAKEVVLPHEETLSKAKVDRLELMSTTFCNFSPIYSLYMDERQRVAGHIDAAIPNDAEVSFVSDEGITQNLWVIRDEKVINKICAEFEGKQLFIADGHHRYETALNFRDKCMAEKGSEGCMCNYVMMFLVEMENDGLAVFPTHRMLNNLDGFDEDTVVAMLGGNFGVEKVKSEDVKADIEAELRRNSDKTVFVMYTGKDYFYRIIFKNELIMAERFKDKSSAYRELDVNVLHSLILEDILGIDTDNLANQKNLTYTKIMDEAIEAVQSGQQQCSFLINATKVSQIKDISLAGEKMPQKSTYFWPKLVTGMVINKFK